jgi:hypothetical protein
LIAERAARRVARESAGNLVLLPNEQLDPFGQRMEDNVKGRRQWAGFFMQSSPGVLLGNPIGHGPRGDAQQILDSARAGNFAKF